MGFWSKLFHTQVPNTERYRDLLERLRNLEFDVHDLKQSMKKLRGRLTGSMRNTEPETSETDEVEEPDIQMAPPPPRQSSAHLSRRFRGF